MQNDHCYPYDWGNRYAYVVAVMAKIKMWRLFLTVNKPLDLVESTYCNTEERRNS